MLSILGRRTFLLAPLALAAAARRPNVLLLVAGQWRAQATPWAGDPDLRTPNLEKFAAGSTAFSRVYSCDPSPAPARNGLETGRFPHARSPQDPTLGGVLTSAGYRAGRRTSGAAIEFLEAPGGAPFYLHVTLEPPRLLPSYDPARLHLRPNVPAGEAAAARKKVAQRYSVYSGLDEVLGHLLQTLDRLRIADDTLVVFAGICGEQLGSQGLDGEDVPFEESVRIPLAIRYPAALPKAVVNDRLVSQVDVMPAILALCGQSLPEGVQGSDLNGEREESVYAEGNLGQKDEWRMVVQGSDKLVVNARSEVTHLYNLAEDPYEMTNLAHDSSAQLTRDRLLAVLRESMRRLSDFKRR